MSFIDAAIQSAEHECSQENSHDPSPDQDPEIRSQEIKDGSDQTSKSGIRLRQDRHNDQQSRDGYDDPQKNHPPVFFLFPFLRKSLKDQAYLAQKIQDWKSDQPVPTVQQDPGRGLPFPQKPLCYNQGPVGGHKKDHQSLAYGRLIPRRISVQKIFSPVMGNFFSPA